MASFEDAVMALSGNQVAEPQLYLADSTREPPWIRWRWRLGIQRWHAPWFGRNVAVRVPKKSRLGQWTGSEFRWGWGRRMCDGRFTMRSRRPSVCPGARVLGIRWCPLRAYDCSKTEHCWAVWTFCRSVFLPKGSRIGKTPPSLREATCTIRPSADFSGSTREHWDLSSSLMYKTALLDSSGKWTWACGGKSWGCCMPEKTVSHLFLSVPGQWQMSN